MIAISSYDFLKEPFATESHTLAGCMAKGLQFDFLTCFVSDTFCNFFTY